MRSSTRCTWNSIRSSNSQSYLRHKSRVRSPTSKHIDGRVSRSSQASASPAPSPPPQQQQQQPSAATAVHAHNSITTSNSTSVHPRPIAAAVNNHHHKPAPVIKPKPAPSDASNTDRPNTPDVVILSTATPKSMLFDFGFFTVDTADGDVEWVCTVEPTCFGGKRISFKPDKGLDPLIAHLQQDHLDAYAMYTEHPEGRHLRVGNPVGQRRAANRRR